MWGQVEQQDEENARSVTAIFHLKPQNLTCPICVEKCFNNGSVPQVPKTNTRRQHPNQNKSPNLFHLNLNRNRIPMVRASP